MSKKQRGDQYAYARRLRDQLIKALGGRCRICGTRKRLEFDHLVPRTWRSAGVTWHRRILRYAREAADGKVAVACRSCNARRGPPPSESASNHERRPVM